MEYVCRAVEGKADFFKKLSIGASGALGGVKLSAVELGARLEFGSQDEITSQLKGKHFILAIGEAQALSQFGLAGFLAYLYDNEKGIKLLVSGSEARAFA